MYVNVNIRKLNDLQYILEDESCKKKRKKQKELIKGGGRKGYYLSNSFHW